MKKLILCLLAAAMLCLTACKPEIETNVSLVAAADIDCQITINEDGTINDSNSNDEYFDFSDWTEIKSVSASQFCFGGIKEDGSVMVTTYPDFELDVSDWTDIKMLEFSLSSAYGLKGDGKVVCASFDDSQSASEINEKVSQWTDIVYINTCLFGIVGVKKDGTVVASLESDNELEEEVQEWTDIKTVSISSCPESRIVGLKNNGQLIEAMTDRLENYDMLSYGEFRKVLSDNLTNYNRQNNGELDQWLSNDLSNLQDFQEQLKGAVKICASDWFTAGLMPDGTLRVILGELYDMQANACQGMDGFFDLRLRIKRALSISIATGRYWWL